MQTHYGGTHEYIKRSDVGYFLFLSCAVHNYMGDAMKHKHYDVIVAWLEGKDVQYRRGADEWKDCSPHTSNCFVLDFQRTCEFRIKPEPKPDVVRNITVEATARCGEEFVQVFKSGKYCFPNLHLTFDGETGKLKSAEVL